MSNTMKQPVETLPEDRSVLFANISFIQNIYDRKSPSQGAGVLHSRHSNDPTIKQLLFSTSFKGNDGKWWRLTDRSNTWAWVQDKSAPVTVTSNISSSTKSIDKRIKEATKLFEDNRIIDNLPPYIKELAFRNQELQGNARYGAVRLDTIKDAGGFDWVKTTQGSEFWTNVYESAWDADAVMKVVGSKEKLFELPPPIQNTITTSTDLGPIIGEEDVKFDTKKDEELSREFQELAFELGCEWLGGGGVQTQGGLYLYINEAKMIERGSTQIYFNDDESKEITIEQMRAQVAAKKSRTSTSNNLIELLSNKTKVKFDTKGDEKLCELFQKVVFQLGYIWATGDKTIRRLDQRYNYAFDDNTIANSNDKDYFERQTQFIEITEQQLKEAADTLKVDESMISWIDELLPKALLNVKENQVYYINDFRYIEGDDEATFLLVLPQNRGSNTDYADKYAAFSLTSIQLLLNDMTSRGYRVLTQKELQPFGQGDEVSINDFLQLNESLISAMKDSTPEVFDAFKEIIDALKEKFPDNVEGTAPIKTSATTKSIDELIDEAKEAFANTIQIKDLPPYLKELALINQEKNGNPRNENFRINLDKSNGVFNWNDTKEGVKFWDKVFRREWTSDIVMQVVGNKENFFKLPYSATTTTATTTTSTSSSKVIEPKDLVGKYIYDSTKDKTYEVTKLSRNNPKNKSYNLRDIKENSIVTWQIPIGGVISLLSGASLNKGRYKIVDNPNSTTQAPTTTPEPTKTKDPNDYSTWSQEDLIKELEEKKEALTYFGEDDEEYIEIKAKINTLELFID
jgi:hypothetical protein